MKTKTKFENRFWMQFTNLPAVWAGQVLVLLWLAPGIGLSQPYQILHQFTNFWGQEYPNADLVLSGNTLYGTTGGYTGRGEVFKINTDGTGYSVLRSHLEQNGASAGLVLSGSTLYGTTINDGCCGYGTVFRLQMDGSDYTVLKEFYGINGAQSYGGLLLIGETLYGTTAYGGVSNCGTVFMLHTDGSSDTVLKNFTVGEGYLPFSRLVLSGTTLYGTTFFGGTGINQGGGVVFKVNTDGRSFGVLKSLDGYSEGSLPSAGLVLSGTTLYGTSKGGGSNNMGTVFKISTDGSGFSVLRRFSGSDGAEPMSRLILYGNTLLGTTSIGGTSNLGTVFSLHTDGEAYTVLKSFTGADGANPWQGGLLLSNGTLYGTTFSGGVSNCGVVFSLSLLPSTSVVPQSQTAEVGATITFRARSSSVQPPVHRWFFNGTNALGDATTNCLLVLTNLQPVHAGTYTVVINNDFGAATSVPAMLNVIPPVERRPVPGVNLSGQIGSSLNVDYTDLLRPAVNWLPLATVLLVSSPQYYFDLSAPLPPQRFYRSWQSAPASVIPTLDLHLIPALTLTGSVDSRVRVDGINQFGPTDAWFTLDTVTLTNASQLYFDVTAPGQPQRLYRLVPVP